MRYAILVIALAVAAIFALSPDDAPRRARSTAVQHLQPLPPPPPPADGVETDRATYRLEYRRAMRFGGSPLPGLELTADLQIQPLAHRDRDEFILSDVHVTGPADGPDADALRDPFHVRAADGKPIQVGFRANVTPAARALLGSLASALQFTDGRGAAWSAIEEDVNGRYEAIYTRRDDGAVERARTYISLRTPAGLARHLAEQVAVEGVTRFERDARGLVQVTLEEQAQMQMGEAPLSATITLRLVRVDVALAPAHFGDRLALGGLVTTQQATSTADQDAALLGDHTPDSLIDAFAALDDLPARSHETSKWRNGQLVRLRALVRTQPDAVGRLVDEVRARAADQDRVPVDLLVGGLSEASTPAAIEGLLALAADDGLDMITRRRVAAGLGSLDHPTPETAKALSAMLDDDALGSAPPLALGNQARELADLDPDAAGDAIDQLIAGYTQATGVAEKRVFLGALGNAGDPRALPIMQEALGGHPALAEAAAFGLRFIPGQTAEALLAGLLQTAGPTRLRVAAVNAVERRDALTWQPMLVAVLEQEADAAVRQAIERVLAVLPS